MVSQFDYQEHASEYGIHWNFYTTIALVSIMMVFLRNPDYALPVAFLLMIGYELVLKEFNLVNYIFYAPRTEFISANREGIATLVGYISL
jgi:phosphatidylinositol glycan class W